MSDSVRPKKWQPIRFPCPWDSPGKNTGVGCHFLLQCMKVKGESEVTQLCPTLSDPMDCSLPGSSIHGLFQGRVLEWGAIAFSKRIATAYLFCFHCLFLWQPILKFRVGPGHTCGCTHGCMHPVTCHVLISGSITGLAFPVLLLPGFYQIIIHA